MKRQITNSIDNKSSRIRLFVLCWGYSIHAERRIKAFSDNPNFEVFVVSTYQYKIEKTTLILLNKDLSSRFYVIGTLRLILRACLDYFILIRAVKKYKPDAIFLQTLMYPCYLAYLLPKSIPYFITFWNGDVLWWAMWNGFERKFKKWIVTYGAKHASAITVNSQKAFNACLDYGVEKKRIHLIRYPGADLSNFYARPKEEAKKKLGITQKNVFFCPRGVVEYTNNDVIVDAALSLLKNHPDTLFIMLTKNNRPAVALLDNVIEKTGFKKNFRWVDHIDFLEMPTYYSASDAMISISSNDSLPNCMLESFACETPVIMGDIEQLHEWVTSGKNGYLVPTRDAEFLEKTMTRIIDPNNKKELNTFTKLNLEKVKKDANSAINIPAVQLLVIDTVSNNWNQ